MLSGCYESQLQSQFRYFKQMKTNELICVKCIIIIIIIFFIFFYRAWHLQENFTFMHMILLCFCNFFFFYMYHVNTLVYQYGLSRFISMVYQELSMIYHSVPWYISKCHGFTIWNLHCVPQQNFSLTVSRNHMIHWHIPHHKNHLS